MKYNVHQLAELANVSVRTIHYYDQIGLLKPAGVAKNGYRSYEEKQLLLLQQILFFRELDFPLDEIKQIMSDPRFDIKTALANQRHLIELKKRRLAKLINTINKTLKKINKQNNMADQDLYGGFSKEEMEKFEQEARERWGHTEAYQQSTARVKKMGKEGLARIQKKNDALLKNLVAHMPKGAKSAEIQALVAQHYNNLRDFYEPNLAMYRGLAEMYVSDQRFTAYYDKHQPGLAVFLREAIIFYCNNQKK